LSYPSIEAILSARLAAGREAFHRQLFDVLLKSAWKQEELPPEAFAAAPLLQVLSRWVAEAPVRDEFGIHRVLAVRQTLRELVEAAGQPFAAFVADVLALDARALADPGALPDWKQVKLAVLADPALLSAAALNAWDDRQPMLARLATICALDSCPLDAPRADAAGAIGRWLMSMAPVPMPQRFLEQLQVSAFHVSYLADPQRHAFKQAIVRQAAHMVGATATAAAAVSSTGRAPGRTRLTIVAELMYPRHAMFRCYAELLEGLMAQYDVTLVAEEPSRCDEHSRFSHKQVYFSKRERDVAHLAAVVSSTQPDIVLYPSIGMTYWTFALSLLRLAPLQLMSIGHPAPSCSDAIDGTLAFSGLLSSPEPEFGAVYAYDTQTVPAPPAGGWQVPAPVADEEGLVVSVNAAAMKLSPPFLDALKELMRVAPAGTRLQFFPNMRSAALASMRHVLLAAFPDAIIQPMTDYRTYMANLARSAVVLQSFPFGGTNTTMDALALGIPVVCLDSGDMAGAADPAILRGAGLGDACVQTPAQFVDLARTLLESATRRAALRAAAGAALARGAAWTPAGTRTLADAVGAARDAHGAR